MPGTIAELIMGNDTFKVLKADFSYFQQLQLGGRVSSDIRGGTFTIEIESSVGSKFDMLANWMTSKSQMQKGVIRFYRDDGIGRFFDLEFYDAYCIKYKEQFNYFEAKQLRTIMTISPGITRVRDLVMEKIWKVSPLASLGAPPPPKPATVRHFINFKIEDEIGNPLQNVELNIILPDGTTKKLQTDINGMIELTNIQPGNCTINSDWKQLKIDDTMIII